jgi:hypothetical protein
MLKKYSVIMQIGLKWAIITSNNNDYEIITLIQGKKIFYQLSRNTPHILSRLKSCLKIINNSLHTFIVVCIN